MSSGELALYDGILGFFVSCLEEGDGAGYHLDAELDVSNALAHEAEKMEGRRVLRPLLAASVENEKCWEKGFRRV